MAEDLLDHPVLGGRMFFPRRTTLENPFWVTAAVVWTPRRSYTR